MSKHNKITPWFLDQRRRPLRCNKPTANTNRWETNIIVIQKRSQKNLNSFGTNLTYILYLYRNFVNKKLLSPFGKKLKDKKSE